MLILSFTAFMHILEFELDHCTVLLKWQLNPAFIAIVREQDFYFSKLITQVAEANVIEACSITREGLAFKIKIYLKYPK